MLIGCSGYRAFGEDHAELGYWIGKPYWGMGYATEAVRALMGLGYEVAAADGLLEVDALQNYLMVLRRSDLRRIGPLDEHYRFYRILDLDLSYALREGVGRLLGLSGLPLVRHRHALWEALNEGDREARSG